MFQDFIGKPSISEGLSLEATLVPVPIGIWHIASATGKPPSCDVHVALLSDNLHSALDLL